MILIQALRSVKTKYTLQNCMIYVADPLEKHNVVDEKTYAKVATELRKEMIEFFKIPRKKINEAYTLFLSLFAFCEWFLCPEQ